MSTSPFPFSQYAVDCEHGAISPKLARDIWLRIREVEMAKARIIGWYAADFTIHDPLRLTIHVYDMYNFHGGIGKKIHQVQLTLEDLTQAEAEEFQQLLMVAYTNAAEAELDRRALEAREQEILELRAQLFGV